MNALNLFYSVSFSAIVVGLGLSSAAQLSQLNIQGESPVNGELASKIEGQYDDNFVIKSLGVNLWAAFDYLVFNEGKQGLIIGKGDWLFSSEEIYHPEDAELNYHNNLNFIRWSRQQLQQSGMDLWVIPVPSKARIYQHHLADIEVSPVHINTYDNFIHDLQHFNINYIDSLNPLLESSMQNHFFKTDTHWTPQGALKIARLAAEQINQSPTSKPYPRQEFITERVSQSEIDGDLTRFLPLSPWFDGVKPKSEILHRYQTYSVQADEFDIFGDSTDLSQPVALIGTSYSHNPNWNFDGALKQSLSMDLVNYAEQGLGPLQPMQQFMSLPEHQKESLQLVIWEIPERYLLMPYPDNYDYMSNNILHNKNTDRVVSLSEANQPEILL